MWDQSCGDPNYFKLDDKLTLIEWILSAIILTSPNHNLFNSGVLRIVSAILAPCKGGLDHNGLANNFN